MGTITEQCSGFFGIRRRFTAVCTVIMEPHDDLHTRWQEARRDLLDWSRKRGEKRQGIELVFFTVPERFAKIKDHLVAAVRTDAELASLFALFPPTVSLMTPDGDVPECYTLGAP